MPDVRAAELASPIIERLVVFGATGDLTGRYLLPGLAALRAGGHLGDRFRLVAAGRGDWTDDQFCEHAAGGRERGGGGAPPRRRPGGASGPRRFPAGWIWPTPRAWRAAWPARGPLPSIWRSRRRASPRRAARGPGAGRAPAGRGGWGRH